MPIYRLLKKSTFGPEEIQDLEAAYEQALRALGVVDRSDPITELIAKKIFELGQRGVRDPAQLIQHTLEELGIVWAKSTA